MNLREGILIIVVVAVVALSSCQRHDSRTALKGAATTARAAW